MEEEKFDKLIKAIRQIEDIVGRDHQRPSMSLKMDRMLRELELIRGGVRVLTAVGEIVIVLLIIIMGAFFLN